MESFWWKALQDGDVLLVLIIPVAFLWAFFSHRYEQRKFNIRMPEASGKKGGTDYEQE